MTSCHDPLCKIDFWKHAVFQYLPCSQQKRKYINMGHSHVQLEGEMNSDKEQLSMKCHVEKSLLFESNCSDFNSSVCAQVKQHHILYDRLP